ncbi:zinc finger protein 532-like [Argiope bruennichi]|uniref:Zinc finger protein 532 like protein n=1 Tax=Argiope bruennichi TaxID=94029 RepID=A0A8T0EFL3_ARGBR|nr:zinc finger protein 532-like [Argiope bruennichi]XP_055953418.1 zinc finger protein 532-like [Argiope bruennichi]KAF8771806.1 Zinc finger protein 532 like protein [Argiope bruennichi]
MSSNPIITSILKLQPKQNIVSTNSTPFTPERQNVPKTVSLLLTPESALAPNNEQNNSSINLKSGNVLKLKHNDISDMCFKGDNLQQLSTNALPQFTPTPPPNPAKANFEAFCCSDCGDTFALKCSLTFHLERRSVLIKFPCEACKGVRIFYNRCTLLSHIRSHADKNEPAAIEKAVVNPLPRVFMDGLQNEFVNTLDDDLNSMDDINETPPSELLEFSLKEDDDAFLLKEKAVIFPNTEKVKCSDCNEEFETAEARKEHLTNGDKIPVMVSQCNKCGMVCPSKCSLKAHQRLHLQVSPYICPECGESPNAYWANFQHHVKYKCFHQSRGIGYKCPVCKRVSPSNESLLKHMELHTEKYLKCESCPRAYISKMNFDEHVKDYHGGKPIKFNTIYKCSLCDIVFMGSESMLTHRSTHLKEQICEYVFNCMQCGKPLENKQLLAEHIKNSHPKIYKLMTRDEAPEEKQSAPSTYKGKIECILCNCKFNNFQGYSVHISRTHVNMNQPCSYCFMIIGNRREMVTHGKKHLKKGNIICLLCNNMKCSDEKRLDAHLSKHHVDKLQYCTVCPICNEMLATFHGTLNHLRVEHFLVTKESVNETAESIITRSENVTCHFCRISFDNDFELQAHLKSTHHADHNKQPANVFTTDEKEQESPAKKQRIEGNICAKCDFQSSEREAFKKHLLTHKTNKSTFQCQECGLCFVVEPALIKHLRIIHKISDTQKYIEEEGTNFMPPDSKTATEVRSCDSLICNVCFTSFPSETQLKTHMRSHGMAFIQATKTNATS